ncbi:MAG: NPCBM/NEW2 domain-containing protein [Eubacteriales bacterium]|nr:NPCBM/NEW2 domain-containing protein [Eubacteriales bacterium]
MPSEIDFLRTRWPKLAAIGAEAERLMSITPAGSIECMQSFCSWAADICLELLDIPVENVATDAEKLNALYASGLIPVDIVEKFRIIFSAGSNAVYRVNITNNEAVTCFNHMLDIGRWMKRESDVARPSYLEQRPGPPSQLNEEPTRRAVHPFTPPSPANGLEDQPSGRAFTRSRPPLGAAGRAPGDKPAEGDALPGERSAQQPVRGMSDPFAYVPSKKNQGGFVNFFEQYRQYFYIGLAALGVIVLGVIIALVVRNAANKKNSTLILPTATPATEVSAEPTVEPTVEPSPTPAEVTTALSSLSPESTVKYLAKDKWAFNSLKGDFSMNGTVYNSGLGMFVASGAIKETRGSQSITYKLDSKYKTLRFDLGCDDKLTGYSDKYGQFRMQIFIDDESEARYNSDFQKFDFFQANIEVDVSNATKVKIVLTEEKGTSGTLNVIMGNAVLVNADGTAVAPSPTVAASASPAPSPAASASPAPSPSPTAGT